MNYKYSRTPHVKWSPGSTSDDVWFLGSLIGKQVIVTEKLDGENSGLNEEKCHARSLDSKDHLSRHWLKQFHAKIKSDIPKEYKIFGENMFAKHSIFYDSLPSYFMAFSIWNNDLVLSWKETLEICCLLDIITVPVLYEGIWDEDKIKKCWTGVSKFGKEQEGYVIRLADSFSVENFQSNVCKMVRASHVTTSQHWMMEKIIPNQLHNLENMW